MNERCLVCGDRAPLLVSVEYNRTLAGTTCVQTVTVTGHACVAHVAQVQDELRRASNEQGIPTNDQKTTDLQGERQRDA